MHTFYLQMQQRLVVLLETALVGGKARERSLSISRSLANASDEVPFFNVPVTNELGDTPSDVSNATPEGKLEAATQFVSSFSARC